MGIQKNGITNLSSFSEYHVEPDNSIWYKIGIHNNPLKNGCFSSSDDFVNGVFYGPNKWIQAGILNQLSKWEFLWIQQVNEKHPILKWRWVQKVNPIGASFATTKAADVTYNTSNGYSRVDSSIGGLYTSSGNAYFVINNGVEGNWFGALGCWAYGWVPGHPADDYTDAYVNYGFMELFVRVDTHPTLLKRMGDSSIATANEFYEI